MQIRSPKPLEASQFSSANILAEWIIVCGLLAGIGAIPLLASRLARWYWAVSLAAGLVVVGTGLFYWFRSGRLARAQAQTADPDQVLVDNELIGRSIRVTARGIRQADEAAAIPTKKLAAIRVETGAGRLDDRRQATILLLLGIFILLTAFGGLLLVSVGMAGSHRVAAYLGTPALMLWAALAGAAFYAHWQQQRAGSRAILAMIRSGVQVLAAFVIWIYLGLPAELTWATWWFGAGAGLAFLGAVVGTVMHLLERRKGRKTDLQTAAEATLTGIEPEPQSSPAGSISEAGVSPPRRPQTAGQEGQQPGRFQIFVGQDGQYYFHLRAASGEILLASEGYTTPAGCRNGVRSVMRNAPIPGRYDCRQAVNGQFYFVLKAANHRIIGRSRLNAAQSGCEQDIATLISAAPQAVIEEDLEDTPGSPRQDPSDPKDD